MNPYEIWLYARTSPATSSEPCKKIVQGNDVCRIRYAKCGLIITFDPSNDIVDWIDNMRFLRSSENTHYGFYSSYKKFRSEIFKYLSSFPTADIMFAGYSRGGALATIAAWDAWSRRNVRSSCMTFGSPLVMFKALRDSYNKAPIYHTNFVVQGDIIPGLPVKAIGYRRVGKTVILPTNIIWRILPYFKIGLHFQKTHNKKLKAKYDKK